jgi:hypothetical protein
MLVWGDAKHKVRQCIMYLMTKAKVVVITANSRLLRKVFLEAIAQDVDAALGPVGIRMMHLPRQRFQNQDLIIGQIEFHSRRITAAL